ncbi:protein abrupt-like [Linepithema humile]|uniref:protein abrupt-like n=1 Tax=Linepithema humile TaxID=83485 RepID=UPI00351E51C9
MMKEDSVLSFKWPSFPSHLVVSLDTCYEKQQFVDLSLVCKDGTILKCHKMVLANSSSFFRRLLVANDHPHPMIILHDVEADDLKTLINFMYCGEIQVVQSEVRRLLKLAEILEVNGLRQIPTSVLFTERTNNTAKELDTLKKINTVSRPKLEETSPKSLSSRSDSRNISSEHETSLSRTQGKARFVPYKIPPKVPQDATKKKEEINVTELCQRLEASSSGISIIDINDMPSTSKGLPSGQLATQQKRKEPSDQVISWPRVLSTISNDKPLPFEKLCCIMDEIEITAGKPSSHVPDNKRNEPLDRRKSKKNPSEHELSMIYIKDEIEISSDVEEDADMDPLEVDEVDTECLEVNQASSSQTQPLYSQLSFHSSRKSTRSHTNFSPRKS